MAHVYFKGQDGTWDGSPNVADLANLANNLMKYLSDGGALLTDKEKAVVDRLLLSVDKILIRENDEYKLFEGLKLDSSGKIIGPKASLINSTDFDPEKYIQSGFRIQGLNDFNRSGDIVLVMKDSTESPIDQRYTSGVACKSWHGSLNPSDSYVPFILSYPGGNSEVLTDVKNSACETDCKGNWELPKFVKEIINEQYGAN